MTTFTFQLEENKNVIISIQASDTTEALEVLYVTVKNPTEFKLLK